jgi:hypothetical protein
MLQGVGWACVHSMYVAVVVTGHTPGRQYLAESAQLRDPKPCTNAAWELGRWALGALGDVL